MKYRKLRTAALAVMAGLCSGCDVGVLVSNPDAVQGVLRDGVALATGAAANWAMFLNEMLAMLP